MFYKFSHITFFYFSNSFLKFGNSGSLQGVRYFNLYLQVVVRSVDSHFRGVFFQAVDPSTLDARPQITIAV